MPSLGSANLDFAAIETLAADETGGDRTLSPFTVAMLNSAFATWLNFRYRWLDDGQPIDDARWDELEALLASGFLEWNQDITPMSNIEIAQFEHTQNQNVGGGSVSANAYTQLPFQDDVIALPAWIARDASNSWTIQPGRYTVDVEHVHAVTTGYSYLALREGNAVHQLGTQLQNAIDRLHVNRFYHEYAAAASLNIAIWSSVALATTGMGVAKNQTGQREHYGYLTIIRLGDV